MSGHIERKSGKVIDLDMIRKENEALRLRTQEGLTYDQIADALGYTNASGAKKAFHRAVKRIEVEEPSAIAQDSMEKIDHFMSKYWIEAENKNYAAFDRIMRMLDMKHELAHLKVTKSQVEVVNYDGGTGGIREEVLKYARIIDYIDELKSTEQQDTITEGN
jgi:transcriptional regulator with XRE-family HTH domain